MSPRSVLTFAVLVGAVLAPSGRAQGPLTDQYGDPLPDRALARLGTARFRHDETVVFATFVPAGNRVVSVGKDGVVCVWEFPSGKQMRRVETLAGSTALLTGATLSPDGKRLTTFADDGFLRVLDLANAREIGKVANLNVTAAPKSAAARALTRNLPAVGPVYSPDGNTLMLVASSRVVQFVDLATAKVVGPALGHTEALTAIWFTADGGQIVTKDANTTRIWNAASGKESSNRIIKLPATQGTPTVISPDGRFGVTVSRFATPVIARNAKSRDAIIFDATTGKEIGQIALDAEVTPIYRRPLHISPDSRMLAVITGDAPYKIELYDIPSGKPLRSLDARSGAAMPAGKGAFGARFAASGQSILFAADGKALAFQASAGATIVVLDIVTGKQIGALPAVDGQSPVLAAFAPDGRCLLLENSDGTVTLFELATGSARCTYGSTLPPGKADPALDEMLGGFAPIGATVQHRSRVHCAIAPDGRLLALTGLRGSIHILDIATAKELAVLNGHRAAVNALAFAHNGKVLASAGDDTTALLWDMTKIARPMPAAKALAPGQLNQAWQVLASSDAPKAFAAMRDFAAAPTEAVAWFRVNVKPATPLNLQRAARLLQQLNDDQFEVRDKATDELLKLGDTLVPLLDKALVDNPAPETRRRLEQLHRALTGFVLSDDRLRAFRAVEVLERIGTPEARQLLQALADGVPGALLTTTAQAALKR